MAEEQGMIVSEGYDAVCLAFGIVDQPGGGKGPFSGFHHKAKGQPGRRSTWATRVSASETRPPGSSRPLLAGSQVLAGFIHQCLAELTEMEQLWIHFCYRDQCKKRGECWVKFLYKYSQQYSELHLKNCRVGTRSEVRGMIAWRMGQAAGEIPQGAHYESINGSISRQSWRKTYQDHWDRICDDLVRVDRAALYKVGVKVGHH